MRHSTTTPTKAEAARFAKMKALGCIACPGLPDTYASPEGRVYSLRRNRLHEFTPSDNGRGYLRVMVWKRLRGVHQLVASAFLGPIPAGLEVNHKDGIKTNNRPENLEYVTRAQNVKHSFVTGLRTMARGQEHHAAKISDDDVRKIIAEYKAIVLPSGRLPHGAEKAMCARHGIKPDYARRLANGECRPFTERAG